jgi:hypothetical protein
MTFHDLVNGDEFAFASDPSVRCRKVGVARYRRQADDSEQTVGSLRWPVVDVVPRYQALPRRTGVRAIEHKPLNLYDALFAQRSPATGAKPRSSG